MFFPIPFDYFCCVMISGLAVAGELGFSGAIVSWLLLIILLCCTLAFWLSMVLAGLMAQASVTVGGAGSS